MKQLATPTPWIPATGGWCLQYVRQAFGLPARYASATEAWEASNSKHRDRNFPAGNWVPVWYGIDIEPLGHVVLLAPNGRVYSTSDYSGWPVIHDSLADLEAFYAYYGMILQYRGWTEDVAGYPVLGNSTINVEGTITTPVVSIIKKEIEEFTVAEAQRIIDILVENQARITAARDAAQLAVRIATENQRRITVTRDVVKEIAAKTGTQVDYEKIDQIVDSSLAAGLDVKITINGQEAA